MAMRRGLRASFGFTAAWDVAGTPAEVAAVLTDLERYPEWWPQVRAVAKIDDDTACVLCRSVLPYTLDLVLTAVTRTPPAVEVRISGDLQGFARFSLAETAAGTRLEFEQEVEVAGALALASYVGRPLLAWNHARMMAGCERGLVSRLGAAAG